MTIRETILPLCDVYAHCYAFVKDDSMPIARAALVEALDAAVAELERDAARYRWLRGRLKVKKMQAASRSIRDGIEVCIGCSFIDSPVPEISPASYQIEQSKKLDQAIDAAIAALQAALEIKT
jgi:hypothetical protein